MLCHSVRSCHWPSLSLNRSLVAIENLATGIPPWVYFTSGSLPRFPIRITLLTLFPAMNALLPPLAETRARTTNQGLDAQYIRNQRSFDLKGRNSLAGRVRNGPCQDSVTHWRHWREPDRPSWHVS